MYSVYLYIFFNDSIYCLCCDIYIYTCIYIYHTYVYVYIKYTVYHYYIIHMVALI